MIISYIVSSSIHSLLEVRTHKWPSPMANVSGFIAQLVRASHWYREVTGSNPNKVLKFSGFIYAIAKIAFTTARIIASLDFISTVHIWSLHISFHRWFIPYGNITTHKWPAPNASGFIAQLIRASHRYREVTGSNPLKSWIFKLHLRNCKNCVHNCEDHIFTWYL